MQPARGRVSGALQSLSSFGSRARQQESGGAQKPTEPTKPAEPAKPSLADISKKTGRGIENTGEAVTVKMEGTGKPAPTAPKVHTRKEGTEFFDRKTGRWRPISERGR
jgi:hypothetical protein